jgi:NTE family protein
MATMTIDKKSIVWGLLRPGRTIGENVSNAYDEYLYHGKTLQDLPADGAGPRFVINATNVQTGKLFRFSRPYQGDYTVGLWRNPDTRIADAVTASSAFPPVLSPHTFAAKGTFDPTEAGVNLGDEFRTTLWMSDGGVYDNLGLETAWKRYRTILVSDGGGTLAAEAKPKRNWAQHGIRVTEIVDGQVRALRRRQIVDAFERGARTGTFWSVRSDVADYHLADPFPIPDTNRKRAQGVRTRLAQLDDETQRDLINWGYVIADTALRKWIYTGHPAPTELPAT